MRLKPTPRRRPRRRVLRTISVVPTLITTGNLLAGVLALVYLQDAMGAEPLARETLWVKAAWLVFVGMLCDALDGRIARLTRSTSAFGAQLDSLADVVTFGVVPAMLARSLLTWTFPMVEPRLLTALVVVYVVGAGLRLARYNVESARVSAEGAGHVTLVFRGLPSPAAAGVVASLVLLRHEYTLTSLDWAILLAPAVLGLLMVSRLPYPHVLNTLFEGSRTIPSVALLVVAVFFFVTYFHETMTVTFVVYGFSGPALMGVARTTGRPEWALREEQDEATEIEIGGLDGGEEEEGIPEAPAAADVLPDEIRRR